MAIELLDALEAIDPAALSGYADWLSIGQGLHHEGYGYEVFGDWLSRNGVQYDEALTRRKWNSFGNYTGEPVTGGTIVKMARDRFGWDGGAPGGRQHRALAWDAVIGDDGTMEEPTVPVLDTNAVGDDADAVEPLFEDGHEVEELRSYLEAMFKPEEVIGYNTVCELDEKRGKWRPAGRGTYSRTMGEVFDSIYRNGIEDGLSATLNREAGAYIRINPLDGKGVADDNVTDYRHALVESDDMPKGKFAAIVRQMNLPVVVLVDSGNKSLHAIVRVDAEDRKQYSARVRLLYERCAANGIKVDEQNKNPARLSRMPGVVRGESRQALVGFAQGADSWAAWDEWYRDQTDPLPDLVRLDTMLGSNLPPLKPALIDGVLRIGHKMLVSGPSKAGKSFALISLCIAFATGGRWFGKECRKSRVMYVNLELDGDSCFNRFADVHARLVRAGQLTGWEGGWAQNIDVWNLRGKAEPMTSLLPKMVRRAKRSGTEVVIIDPIYKVITGDENSAADMAAFANLFDALCDQAGVSAIYCHHHSKGYQGGKRSVDRASGSGVFGRDPDAILDMVELEVDAGDTWKFTNDAICAECARTVSNAGGYALADWRNLPESSRAIEANAVRAACDLLPADEAGMLAERCDAIRGAEGALSAWRVEGTLREFPKFEPVSAWFSWPLHIPDATLADKHALGDDEAPKKPKSRRGWRQEDTEKAAAANRAKAEKAHKAIVEAFTAAYRRCVDAGLEPTPKNVHEHFPDFDGTAVTIQKIREWSKERNASWCPVQKSGRIAKDGKTKLLELRGEEGSTDN